MTREGALLVMVAVAVAVLGLMAWGWIRRIRRDSGLTAPFGARPEASTLLGSYAILFVATTAPDQPLERLAVKGLRYRARGVLDVTDAGLALALDGERSIFLPASSIVDVARSSVVIDRVVERDGLVRVRWRIDGARSADFFLRPQDVSTRVLVDSISAIVTGSTGDVTAPPAKESDA